VFFPRIPKIADMSATAVLPATVHPAPVHARPRERAPTRWLLIAISVVFLSLFLLLPLVSVFVQALEQGWKV